MISNFLEGISGATGEKIAGDWLERLFGPALLFWGGGLLLVSFFSWVNPLLYFFEADTIQQISLGIAFIALIVLSDMVVEWVTLPFLRLLEGYYWPAWLKRLVVNRLRRKLAEKDRRLEVLDNHASPLSLAQEQEYIQLETELALYPEWNYLMPTRLGNLLRAAEEHPYKRYGLEAITVWPHLWLVLPDKAQQELSSARRQLDRAAQLLLWGGLFWLWTWFSWWAAPIVLLTLLIAYSRMIQTATIYSTLIRVTFDLHRFELYRQICWKLPTKKSEEIPLGKALTQYILRGFTNSDFDFEH